MSRPELAAALQAKVKSIMPKAISKMTKAELAHAVTALEIPTVVAEKIPKKPAPRKEPREIIIGDDGVPEVPVPKLKAAAPPEETKAFRQALQVQHKIKKMAEEAARELEPPEEPKAAPKKGRGRPKKVMEVVEEESDVEEAVKTKVRSTKPKKVAEVTAEAPPPKKKHICNCGFCDKKGKTF